MRITLILVSTLITSQLSYAKQDKCNQWLYNAAYELLQPNAKIISITKCSIVGQMHGENISVLIQGSDFTHNNIGVGTGANMPWLRYAIQKMIYELAKYRYQSAKARLA